MSFLSNMGNSVPIRERLKWLLPQAIDSTLQSHIFLLATPQ